jgi:hypothetical protein
VLTWGIITATFLVPFVALLSEAAKRNRIVVGLGATSVLAGLYGERYLLVLRPAVAARTVTALIVAILIAAGVAASFVLVVSARLGTLKMAADSRPDAGGAL